MTADLTPKLTEFEKKVFAMFERRFKPGYGFPSFQLEGDKQLAVVAAGHRLMKKGLVYRIRSCVWTLSNRGEQYILKQREAQKAGGN